MSRRAWVIRNGLMYYLLTIVQTCLLTPKVARADRRCPLPQPIAVGDVQLNAPVVIESQLPLEVRRAILNLVPKGYTISRIVKSDFSEDKNISDYLVFYDNYATAIAKGYMISLLSIVRWNPASGVQVFPVFRAWGAKADVAPIDLNIYRSWNGMVYAKTLGTYTGSCRETIVFWDSERFVVENIFFDTSDGFNYPVGPIYPVDIQTASFPDGWKIDQGFQDCKNYPAKIGPCKHLGEDFNGKGGGDTDLGYPVFAVARGEVIFAGDAGYGWNGIVVLRHRPPTGEDVYSFYGHLNIDANTRRVDGSAIRTVTDILQQSAPGHLVEVEKGQLIGYIGPRPTKDTSAHLHFEIITDPAIAYNEKEWKGYRPLYGSEAQWKNPSKFIEENRSYWTNFSVGEDWSQIGISPAIFEECYERNGGLQVLGKPIGTVLDTSYGWPSLSGPWKSQAFQNGEIYYRKDDLGIFAILNPLLAKFKMLLSPRGPLESWDMGGGYGQLLPLDEPLGLPIADVTPVTETSFYDTKFKFQNFEGGALEFHQTGPFAGEVFEVHGAIFSRWSSLELNYAAGPLGLPTSDEKEAVKSAFSGLTGRFSIFEGGVIHWIRETDKTYVIGLNQNVGGQKNIGKLIADRYKAEGGSDGDLGFPVSDDYLSQDGVRCDFENGCIVWTPSKGIQAVVFKK